MLHIFSIAFPQWKLGKSTLFYKITYECLMLVYKNSLYNDPTLPLSVCLNNRVPEIKVAAGQFIKNIKKEVGSTQEY